MEHISYYIWLMFTYDDVGQNESYMHTISFTVGSTSNNDISSILADYRVASNGKGFALKGFYTNGGVPVYDKEGKYIPGQFWNADGTYTGYYEDRYSYEHPAISGDTVTECSCDVNDVHEQITGYGVDVYFSCTEGSADVGDYFNVRLIEGSTELNTLPSQYIPQRSGYVFKGYSYGDLLDALGGELVYDENGRFIPGQFWNADGTYTGYCSYWDSETLSGTTDLVAEWEQIESQTTYLTINYYSNHANALKNSTSGEPVIFTLSEDENILIHTDRFACGDYNSDLLRDYSGLNEDDTLMMRRSGYLPTTYWNTSPDGTGIRLKESEINSSIEDFVLTLGYNLREGNVMINLYPEWVPQTEIYIYDDGRVYAGDFISGSETIFIDGHNSIIYAKSFIQSDMFSYDKDGNMYGNFILGSPKFPAASNLSASISVSDINNNV